jgi:hypothetical protein
MSNSRCVISRRLALVPMLGMGLPVLAFSPLVLTMLPITVQVLGQLFGAYRQEQAQERLMAAQLAIQYAGWQMQAGQVGASHFTFNDTMARLGWLSRNADGAGTQVGLFEGRVAVMRDGIGGFLTPDELTHVAENPGRIPVPVTPSSYESRLTEPEMRQAVAVAAKRNGEDAQGFMGARAPAGVRRFATGRSRSTTGDLQMLLTVDRPKSQSPNNLRVRTFAA